MKLKGVSSERRRRQESFRGWAQRGYIVRFQLGVLLGMTEGRRGDSGKTNKFKISKAEKVKEGSVRILHESTLEGEGEGVGGEGVSIETLRILFKTKEFLGIPRGRGSKIGFSILCRISTLP